MAAGAGEGLTQEGGGPLSTDRGSLEKVAPRPPAALPAAVGRAPCHLLSCRCSGATDRSSTDPPSAPSYGGRHRRRGGLMGALLGHPEMMPPIAPTKPCQCLPRVRCSELSRVSGHSAEMGPCRAQGTCHGVSSSANLRHFPPHHESHAPKLKEQFDTSVYVSNWQRLETRSNTLNLRVASKASRFPDVALPCCGSASCRAAFCFISNILFRSRLPFPELCQVVFRNRTVRE